MKSGTSTSSESGGGRKPTPFIAMGSIGQLLSLWIIMSVSKSEKTRQASGALYNSHSRTINDMIQYALYHRAF
jgi:hypothetical protein